MHVYVKLFHVSATFASMYINKCGNHICLWWNLLDSYSNLPLVVLWGLLHMVIKLRDKKLKVQKKKMSQRYEQTIHKRKAQRRPSPFKKMLDITCGRRHRFSLLASWKSVKSQQGARLTNSWRKGTSCTAPVSAKWCDPSGGKFGKI